MKSEEVVLCWSGGKDSAMSLYELQKRQDQQVVALLTTVTEEYDRISMHGVRRSLLREQAASLGYPVHEVCISPGATNAEYEAKLDAAFDPFRRQGVETVAFGDIFLEDLKDYREQHLSRCGMRGLFPIWRRDSQELAETFLQLGFKAITSCVDPNVLDRSFVGRQYDQSFLVDLPTGVDPCGENGEFHTFVYDGPIFESEVAITCGEVVSRDSFLYCDLVSET